MRTPYAYLCQSCNHFASRHGLAEGGDLRGGPYVCADCGCAIAQDAPMIPLTEAQYRRQAAS